MPSSGDGEVERIIQQLARIERKTGDIPVAIPGGTRILLAGRGRGDFPDLADVVVAILAAAGCLPRRTLFRIVSIYAYLNGLEDVYDFYPTQDGKCYSGELDLVIHELLDKKIIVWKTGKVCLAPGYTPDMSLMRDAKLAVALAKRYKTLDPACKPPQSHLSRSVSPA